MNRGMIPEALKLEALPRDLEYPKGIVSVIPDPKDREDGRIIVYPINDPDEPLKDGLSTVRNCFQEVSINAIWTLSSSPRWQDCGTGLIFESKDLPPHHAAILLENDPAIGDLTGSLRCCVNIQGSKAIASAPFEGRFRSKEFDRAGDGVTSPAGRFLHDIPLAAKAPAWKEIEAAKKREEIVASLELQRHCHADWAICQRTSQWAEILAKENADEASVGGLEQGAA